MLRSYQSKKKSIFRLFLVKKVLAAPCVLHILFSEVLSSSSHHLLVSSDVNPIGMSCLNFLCPVRNSIAFARCLKLIGFSLFNLEFSDYQNVHRIAIENNNIFFLVPLRVNPNNTTGLDEYVDILQVQQLLLDSSPSTSCIPSTSSSRVRPKVNLQKASEYSTQTQGNNFY